MNVSANVCFQCGSLSHHDGARETEGTNVGTLEGNAEGKAIGLVDGVWLCSTDGCSDGCEVGTVDGTPEGCEVGEIEFSRVPPHTQHAWFTNLPLE